MKIGVFWLGMKGKVGNDGMNFIGTLVKEKLERQCLTSVGGMEEVKDWLSIGKWL